MVASNVNRANRRFAQLTAVHLPQILMGINQLTQIYRRETEVLEYIYINCI